MQTDERREQLLGLLLKEREEVHAAVRELLRELYRDHTWQTKETMVLVLKIARLVSIEPG